MGLLLKKLFLRATPLTGPFTVLLVDSWAFSVDPGRPVSGSATTSNSLRERLLFGDGDGERDADAHDFLANFESEPETDRALTSRSGVRPSVLFTDSCAISSAL